MYQPYKLEAGDYTCSLDNDDIFGISRRYDGKWIVHKDGKILCVLPRMKDCLGWLERFENSSRLVINPKPIPPKKTLFNRVLSLLF